MKGCNLVKDGRAGGKGTRDVEKKFGGVRRRRVLNGCIRPVLRVERSCGGRYMTGGAGTDAASSAQSRRVATGVGHGGTGLEGGETRSKGHEMGAGGEQGPSVGVDGVISNAAGV